MKKLFKIVVCMAFAVLLTTVTAFAAEPSVSYHTSSANNIVIKGIITDAYGGELVSIKAEDSAGYAHLGIAQCEADGSYTYKFSYDGDASKLKVSVRQGSNCRYSMCRHRSYHDISRAGARFRAEFGAAHSSARFHIRR